MNWILANPDISSFVAAICLQYTVNYKKDGFTWKMAPFGKTTRFITWSILFFEFLLRDFILGSFIFGIIMVLEYFGIIQNLIGGPE